jgi:hypothetical protein
MDNEIKTVRLTDGPKHHLFGFHDLIAWNTTGDKLLSLEVDIINRPPLAEELFGVGYVKNNSFVRLGETSALNYPQGARQQWIGETNCFTVNNLVKNKWGTNIYDTDQGKLIDTLDTTTHCLSKDGKYSYSIDYERLHRLGGYGYIGVDDPCANEAAPSKQGIWIQNLDNKDIRLLISIREVAEVDGTYNPNSPEHHYVTHLVINPSSTRLAFLHRYFLPDGGMMTRLMSIGTDGSGIRCLAKGFLSHFDWKDDKNIYIWGRANSNFDAIRNNPLLSNPLLTRGMQIAKKCVKLFIGKQTAQIGKSFLMISDEETPKIEKFGVGILTEDGHPMTSPTDKDLCIIDTYPDENGIRLLMLYRFGINSRKELGTFKMIDNKPDMTQSDSFIKGVDSKILSKITKEQLAFTRSGLHCDLHPRWNFDGTKVAFDSIHEGTRQIYMVDVQDTF